MDLRKPMTDLLEFCRKINCGRLEFNYSKGEESSFNCKVTLLDMEANGSGGSKDDAREVAAFNLLRKLDELPECGDLVKIEDKGESNELIDPNRNMFKELWDFCNSHDMPSPIFEMVEKSRNPNAPKFVACCTLASIKRYGISDKKKEAHQRAASAILSVVSKDADKLPKSNGVKLVPIGTAEDEESEGCDAFETYKKLIQPQKKPKSGDMLLCDRHNYFKNFPQDLKLAAFEILDRSSDKNYPDVKQRALKVMSALKLNHKITPMPSRSVKPILMLEFDCEYDAVLMGYESDIYTQVIQYFRNMLD